MDPFIKIIIVVVIIIVVILIVLYINTLRLSPTLSNNTSTQNEYPPPLKDEYQPSYVAPDYRYVYYPNEKV